MTIRERILAVSEEDRLQLRMRTFLRKIFLPGIIMVYFISSEPDFVRDFTGQFSMMGPGEYMYLTSHIMLVYFLMPLAFFSEILVFFGASVFQFTYYFFSLISRSLFMLLALAALGKIIFELTV